MREIKFEKNISINRDKLLIQRDLSVYLECDNYYSTHRISKYQVLDGELEGEVYYVFDYIDGKAIMNYMPINYYELSRHITIDENEPIFQSLKYLDGCDNLYLVPVSYRND